MRYLTLDANHEQALAVDVTEASQSIPDDENAQSWFDFGMTRNGWKYRWSTNGYGRREHWVTLWFDGPADPAEWLLMNTYFDIHETLGLPEMQGKWDQMEHSHDLCFCAWDTKFEGAQESAYHALSFWKDVVESPALLNALIMKYGESRNVDEVFETYGIR